jgi:hypothetical protein
MKLLVEEIDFQSCEVLTEGTGPQKGYSIKGIFMQGWDQLREAPVINRNGRAYPLPILEREAKRYVENYVARGSAFGELDHPPTPQVNLRNVSHRITELKRDGSNFLGVAKLLETDSGKIARALIEGGCRLGVSSRGVGNLERSDKGFALVKDDYHLITPADIVADPSAPKAFVDAMMEGCEWVYIEGRGWTERFVEAAKKEVNKTSRADREALQLRIFETFMLKLRSNI